MNCFFYIFSIGLWFSSFSPCFAQEHDWNRNQLITFRTSAWKEYPPEGYGKLFAEPGGTQTNCGDLLRIKDSVFTDYVYCKRFKEDSCSYVYQYSFVKKRNVLFLRYKNPSAPGYRMDSLLPLVKKSVINASGDFPYYTKMDFYGNRWEYLDLQKIKVLGEEVECYVFKYNPVFHDRRKTRIGYYYLEKQSLVPVQIEIYQVNLRRIFRRERILERVEVEKTKYE